MSWKNGYNKATVLFSDTVVGVDEQICGFTLQKAQQRHGSLPSLEKFRFSIVAD